MWYLCNSPEPELEPCDFPARRWKLNSRHVSTSRNSIACFSAVYWSAKYCIILLKTFTFTAGINHVLPRDFALAVDLEDVGSLVLTSCFITNFFFFFFERIQKVHTCSTEARSAASCGRLNQKQIETVRARATEFAQLPPSFPSFFPFTPSLLFFRSLPTFNWPAITSLEPVPAFPLTCLCSYNVTSQFRLKTNMSLCYLN